MQSAHTLSNPAKLRRLKAAWKAGIITDGQLGRYLATMMKDYPNPVKFLFNASDYLKS